MIGEYVGWICYRYCGVPFSQNDLIFTEKRQELVNKVIRSFLFINLVS